MKGNNGVSMLTHAKGFEKPCSLLRGKGMNDVSSASEDFALFSTHSRVSLRKNVNVIAARLFDDNLAVRCDGDASDPMLLN